MGCGSLALPADSRNSHLKIQFTAEIDYEFK